MNGTLDLIRQRISLRKYAERPVSKEHYDLIIEAALRAPTAGNMMLYSILHIRDQEKKKKLSASCDNQPFIAKAPLVLIFLADMQRYEDYFHYSKVKEFCQQRGMEYRKTSYSSLFLSICDAMIAAQNAVIAAESLGIGSCYIGDIMENYEFHKEMLDLPDKVFPICLLCLGYYPEGLKRKMTPRFDKQFIVFADSYKRLGENDFREMFSDAEKRVLPGNPWQAENFGQFTYARKFGALFFEEMERSVGVILKHWNS